MKPFRAPELRASLADAMRRRERDHGLQQQALGDELTGLYNRRGFFALAEQQLKVAKRSWRPVMVAVADVNGLKAVNDALGHEMGDRLIQRAALALRQTFRSSDIIARLGGDEFAVLLVDPDSSAPQVVEQRLQVAVREINAGLDPRCELSISVGICMASPDTEQSLSTLLAEADAKMYLVKATQSHSRITIVP
jgi:diguanylate cyclase (GGDEF)-like protein